MEKIKKIWGTFERLVAVFVPGVAFAIMFSAFCLQIFSRYILKHQFEFTYDYTVICFLWTTCLGAIYASNHREHVSFALLYDKFGPKGRAVLNLAGNVLICIAFLLLIRPTAEYLDFISIKKTAVLKVSFEVLYAPFLVFLVFAVLYMIRDTVVDILTLRTPTAVLLQREAEAKEAHRREVEQAQAAFEAQIHSLSDADGAGEEGRS
ncbi:MAG: TRAP transporter small permease [Oscillospiraceae bacterium]|nr:TRAP transporter small permease [Oscillospiraceae bacterium]